jgi:hypothetical protein
MKMRYKLHKFQSHVVIGPPISKLFHEMPGWHVYEDMLIRAGINPIKTVPLLNPKGSRSVGQ